MKHLLVSELTELDLLQLHICLDKLHNLVCILNYLIFFIPLLDSEFQKQYCNFVSVLYEPF